MQAEKAESKTGHGAKEGIAGKNVLRYLRYLFGRAAGLTEQAPLTPAQAATWGRFIAGFRRAAIALTEAFCGFVLARGNLFGAQVFGISFLCATAENTPLVLLGVIGGTYLAGKASAAWGIGVLVSFGVRYCVSRIMAHTSSLQEEATTEKESFFSSVTALLLPAGVFAESIWLRVAAAAVGSCVGGIISLRAGGETAGAVLAPLLASLGCWTVAGAYTTQRCALWQRRLAAAALTAGIIFAVRDIVVLGISIKTVCALFATLCFAVRGGFLLGCTAGLCFGLVCDAAYAVAFAIAGLLCGALRSFWGVGICAAVFGAGGYACAVGGFGAMRGVVPELCIGGVLFWPMRRIVATVANRFDPVPTMGAAPEAKEQESTDAHALRERALTERLQTLSQVLQELSGAFYALSDQMRRPAGTQLRALCGSVCKRWCRRCSNESICWGEAYEKTSRAVEGIAEALVRGTHAADAPLPDFLRSRCRCLSEILREVDDAVASLYETQVKNDKTAVFAADYACMARLLSTAVSAHAKEYQVDDILSRRLQRTLEYLHFRADSLQVFAGRRRAVIAHGLMLGNRAPGAAALRKAVGQVTGVCYGAPSYYLGGRGVTLYMDAVPAISVRSGGYTSPGFALEENGDSFVCFESNEAYAYAILCDGMGSGAEAALTARICCLVLEKLLRGGNDKQVSLEMLNAFFRARQTECSCTVDLLEVDLLQRRACLIKSGAAPSYVLREGKVFQIASASAPIGILRNVGAEKTAFEVQSGDCIILLSDGMAQTEQMQTQLITYLEKGICGDMQAQARALVGHMQRQATQRDDRSCVLVQIEPVQGTF